MGEAVVETPIALGMLVALLVCFALQNIWKATFGPFLHWLGGLAISASVHGIGFSVKPFHYAETLNNSVQQYLTQAVAMAEKRFVQALNVVVEPFLLMAGVTLALGLAADEGFRALWSHITHVAPQIARDTLWKPAVKALERTDAFVRARLSTLTHRLDALAARVAHVAASIPHAIPQVIPRLGRLERTAIDYTKLHKWLSRALLGTLGATAVATALRALKLGFLRCSNFRKAGKRTCGMDTSLLDALLADTLLVVGTLSLVEFAKEMETVTGEVAPLLQRFWRAV